MLSFPAQVDPLDTGVSNVERESARIAFVQPTKGLPGVRPGKLYQAGAKIYDYQYRFNKTAADAIRQSRASSNAPNRSGDARLPRRCRSARCDDANQAVG